MVKMNKGEKEEKAEKDVGKTGKRKLVEHTACPRSSSRTLRTREHVLVFWLELSALRLSAALPLFILLLAGTTSCGSL